MFLGAASLVLAIGAIVATNANPPVPDYYINDAGACVEAPVTNCLRGTPTCVRTIPGQSTPKQLFDIKNASGNCQFTLQEQ